MLVCIIFWLILMAPTGMLQLRRLKREDVCMTNNTENNRKTVNRAAALVVRCKQWLYTKRYFLQTIKSLRFSIRNL